MTVFPKKILRYSVNTRNEKLPRWLELYDYVVFKKFWIPKGSTVLMVLCVTVSVCAHMSTQHTDMYSTDLKNTGCIYVCIIHKMYRM